MREEHLWRVNRYRINHGRQPQQRLQLCVYINALDAELGAGCVFRGDLQVVDGKFQRSRLKVHRAHCDGAAQLA